jgi:hypothetical protein
MTLATAERVAGSFAGSMAAKAIPSPVDTADPLDDRLGDPVGALLLVPALRPSGSLLSALVPAGVVPHAARIPAARTITSTAALRGPIRSSPLRAT